MGWAEAGVAVPLSAADGSNQPDAASYHGGVSFCRAWGLLGAETQDILRNHEGGVFGSCFNNTLLFWRADPRTVFSRTGSPRWSVFAGKPHLGLVLTWMTATTRGCAI